ncbi:hypothetical protein DPMN_173274 [Dreissena polymorpha]|uniref:Ig-like domain-containing protein n=1 Tax=Dreissena polymorpha TaxID=45954 RepID=A0A9D4E4S7_DREPO|nr:hypothetical protein DPMN_173274 [Dreissena polymorpha]
MYSCQKESPSLATTEGRKDGNLLADCPKTISNKLRDNAEEEVGRDVPAECPLTGPVIECPVTGPVNDRPVAEATWSRTGGEKSRQAELSPLRPDLKVG